VADVIGCGAFDDIRSRQLRFLQQAATRGTLHVVLWTDEAIVRQTGRPPKFPLAERKYFLESLRFVADVTDTGAVAATSPAWMKTAEKWLLEDEADAQAAEAVLNQKPGPFEVIPSAELAGFPALPPAGILAGDESAQRVIVTGCYDWFHSGHVRFFEEASALGELYVVVGHDANIRLLKGEGHPLFSQDERRYIVSCVRFVKQALISTGDGWLDAEPEIARLRPHRYAVNEDGDRPEKRAFCESHGIEYCVLKRTPKPGLPRRQSTDLRGF